MTLSRWDRLESLLAQAGALSEPERSAFVSRETEGDPELRAELTALLNASHGAEDFVSRLRHEVLGTDVQGLLREAPRASDPWIGRTVSHYEILDRLGGGGMGVVYRARDVKLDRAVALKFIAPEIRRDSRVRQRFLQEARAASALDHPNICTIHEIAETDDGRLFIVMALYDGETLRARIERGAVPEREALDLGEQIAHALAAAHERGIVHRDVKPDNVFVTKEGVVKLLDFGLARTDDSRMTGPGAAEGTVAYMSPEQIGGQRADERSDVWALGVILFEMLAGVRPFAADDPGTAVQLILTQEPNLRAKRPALAPEIGDLVQRALSKDPARRFPGGRQFVEALHGHRLKSVRSVPRRGAFRALRNGAAVAAALIPVTAAALWIRADRRPARPALPSGSVSHVLWVDDNPENNTEVIAQLRALGVRVTTELSTQHAVERYEPSAHQLVISDMGRYEGVDDAYVDRAGFDLLERLRAGNPDVRLVFCTSERAVTTFRAEALAEGALDIVTDCRDIVRLIGF